MFEMQSRFLLFQVSCFFLLGFSNLPRKWITQSLILQNIRDCQAQHWKGGEGPRGKWGHKFECKKPVIAPEKFDNESKADETSTIHLEVNFRCAPKNLFDAFTDAKDISA